MTETFGTLERVPLREAWGKEDRDFTPWLAENLKLLADTLELELELKGTEINIGSFRADIVCKNTGDNSWVLIENQLETTNHGHLGKSLTYAAGLHTVKKTDDVESDEETNEETNEAVSIIWIARKFREEHRAALDWLNEITSENFHFFGLEIELWKIGNSPPALKFNIVSQPNNWTESIAQNISQNISLTDKQKLHFLYWQQLVDLLKKESSNIKSTKPRHDSFQRFSIGRSGARILTIHNIQKNEIGIRLRLKHHKHTKGLFNLLLQDKEEIEKELGEKLEWREQPEKTASRIALYKEADTSNKSDWTAQHQWLKEKLEGFYRVFGPRVKSFPRFKDLDPVEWDEEEDEE